ncbi:menaquinone biosynthesis protein [bacterium]|nr:menaquinone biosynthesis protein [bacterium]
MEKKLKLGVIEVLNVLPVYYSIIKGTVKTPCDFSTGKVTELNKKLERGEIDVSVVSSFEFARNPQKYYIFPNLSVGADGPVRSIYLFLKKPLEQLNGDLIKLTEFSLTSVHLIQYLLKDLDVEFTQQKNPNAVGELLIADEAIRRFYTKSDPYVYDLSELWKEKTGLPFVFALWVCRKDIFKTHSNQVIETYFALLESKKRSSDLYQQMALESYRGIFPDEKSCLEYLRNIHYELSFDYQQGFMLFQKKLFDLKKLNQVAPLEFLPGV